jgi:hypothetical protein
MPSRKLSDRCVKCGCKNHLRAKFCNECGGRLDPNRAPRDDEGRVKLHADVAHPINMPGREQIQREVIAAFLEEADDAQQPGYEPAQYDPDEDVPGGSDYDELIADLKDGAARRSAERGGHVGDDNRPAARPIRDAAPSSGRGQRRDDRSDGRRAAKVQDDFAAGLDEPAAEDEPEPAPKVEPLRRQEPQVRRQEVVSEKPAGDRQAAPPVEEDPFGAGIL